VKKDGIVRGGVIRLGSVSRKGGKRREEAVLKKKPERNSKWGVGGKWIREGGIRVFKEFPY
jgi:hypothetical protein